jgi:hypothetical protein
MRYPYIIRERLTEFWQLSITKRAACGRLILAFLGGLAAACTPVIDAEYWRTYQAELQRIGYLRTERAPTDAQFSNADLIENFRRIIFFDEFVLEDGEFRNEFASRNLEKQTGDVGYSIHGESVTDLDLEQIKAFADRMSGVTGLTVRRVEKSDANVFLMILTEAEREELASELTDSEGLEAIVKDLTTNLGGDICVAYPLHFQDNSRKHMIVIPNELTGLMRQSCIEEEFGQAFGPSADYEKARPSIFNDDEEFALFTVHDEWLFRVLYDPRLTRGMTEEEGMPIVRRIVQELRPEDSITVSQPALDETKAPLGIDADPAEET